MQTQTLKRLVKINFLMDHGYLLRLSIHLAEIPTSPQNFANTLGLKWTH